MKYRYDYFRTIDTPNRFQFKLKAHVFNERTQSM